MADIQLAPTPERTAAGLIPAAAIDALARQIAAQFDPERIYLFGSYAYGTPTTDSDVDLLVVMNTADTMHQAGEIRSAVRFAYPRDVLVYTPINFAERLALGDFFIQQVYEQGRVLYDSGRPTLRNALLHPLVDKNAKEKVGRATLNKLAAEWVTKAERDYRSAYREANEPDDPNFDLACYLAQQCAEKYLKAFLQEHNVRFAKTHELTMLLSLCQPLDSNFSQLLVPAAGLKGYESDPRYPGFAGTMELAQVAYQDATAIRTFVRTKLGI